MSSIMTESVPSHQQYALTTLGLLAAQTVVFVTVWTAVHRFVARHGPISWSKTFAKVNNSLYSAASVILLLVILSPSHDRLARRLYHASKLYEYLDVLGVRASGGDIDLHFAVHHLTTPYLTYFRVLHNSTGWKPCAAVNAFHHILMYAYFAGLSRVRSALLVTGVSQLLVGVVVEGWIIGRHRREGDDVPWPNVFALGLGVVISVLFARDAALRAREKEKSKAG